MIDSPTPMTATTMSEIAGNCTLERARLMPEFTGTNGSEAAIGSKAK